MDLTSQKIIKILLREEKTVPKKCFGQNFIIDKKVIDKMIEAAELCQCGLVLEIGPGIGSITEELAKKVKRVIAVEKDKRMADILKKTLKSFNNIEIINKDILEFDLSVHNLPRGKTHPLNNGQYKIVANLPFYLTAPVIRKFLETANPPKEMVLIVQKEIAQKICSNPPNMSILAISVQVMAEAKIISRVSNTFFWPKPKVDSAIIKITPKKPIINSVLIPKFFEIVKAGFAHPRKQILNNLADGFASKTDSKVKSKKEDIKLWLLANKIQPTRRAGTLTVKDWINLTKSYKI